MDEIFIDTEFNGFGGELISMALVDQGGLEFYEVLRVSQKYDPWVQQNVVPHLQKEPIDRAEFQEELLMYLSKYKNGFTLIADWPDDLRYFLEVIMTGPGYMMPLPSFGMKMMRDIRSENSEVPHNALYDARAIKENYNA